MAHAVIILAVLLPVLMAACFLLGRHLQRRQQYQEELSPVSRQHIDLFQGGQLFRRVMRHASDWVPPPGTWAQVGEQIH